MFSGFSMNSFNQSINTRSILTDRPVNLTPPCLATDMVFRSAIAERKRQLVDFSTNRDGNEETALS